MWCVGTVVVSSRQPEVPEQTSYGEVNCCDTGWGFLGLTLEDQLFSFGPRYQRKVIWFVIFFGSPEENKTKGAGSTDLELKKTVKK